MMSDASEFPIADAICDPKTLDTGRAMWGEGYACLAARLSDRRTRRISLRSRNADLWASGALLSRGARLAENTWWVEVDAIAGADKACRAWDMMQFGVPTGWLFDYDRAPQPNEEARRIRIFGRGGTPFPAEVLIDEAFYADTKAPGFADCIRQQYELQTAADASAPCLAHMNENAILVGNCFYRALPTLASGLRYSQLPPYPTDQSGAEGLRALLAATCVRMAPPEIEAAWRRNSPDFEEKMLRDVVWRAPYLAVMLLSFLSDSMRVGLHAAIAGSSR